MARYGKTSKHEPKTVIEKARAFFGPGGEGLTVVEVGDCCVRFQGGGGLVEVRATQLEKGSDVEILSREWDYQAKTFLQMI